MKATIRRYNLTMTEIFLPKDDLHERWRFTGDVEPRDLNIDVTTFEEDIRYMSSLGYVDGWVEIEIEYGELYRYTLLGKNLNFLVGRIYWSEVDHDEDE